MTGDGAIQRAGVIGRPASITMAGHAAKPKDNAGMLNPSIRIEQTGTNSANFRAQRLGG